MQRILNELLDKWQQDIIKDIQTLVAIPSVESDPVPGGPFGPALKDAVNWMVKRAEELGFLPINDAGYAVQVPYGSGGEPIGVLTHLDVVPAGNDWTYPPFAAEIHDGRIYGRGTSDNKGPAVATLYALRAIKESGLYLSKPIHLIFGTDEESGWLDLDHYFKHYPLPQTGFSPDAGFPIIHAEKGHLVFAIDADGNGQNAAVIERFSGGERANVVPDRALARVVITNGDCTQAMAMLKAAAAEARARFDIEVTGGNIIEIKAKGVGAHASVPDEGVNAVAEVARVLSVLELPAWQAAVVGVIAHRIRDQYDGAGIGVDLCDEVSGKLTLSLGIMDMDGTHAHVVCDIRYPVSLEGKDVFGRIEKSLAGSGVTLKKMSDSEPHFVPKDSELVKALAKVYEEATGQPGEAYAIGGGTYARILPQGVAFGAGFPGEEELAHQANEYIAIDSLVKATKIFAQAMYELAK